MDAKQALSTVTFSVRRPGMPAWATELDLRSAVTERNHANAYFGLGHHIVVDDATGLTDDAVVAFRESVSASDHQAVGICDLALRGDTLARGLVADMWLETWARRRNVPRLEENKHYNVEQPHDDGGNK